MIRTSAEGDLPMTADDMFWAAIPRDISRVAVIGAGAMGGGIAAQFANAGVDVLLFDVAGPVGVAGPDDDRSAAARAGIARQVALKGFMGASGPGRVTPLNTEDDLARLAEVDWIVEVVVERLEVKRALYARIDAVLRPGTIVSSNTSTLLHAQLVEGRSPAFRRNFVITHFFNPPRLMPLLEVVATAETEPAALARVQAAARDLLGKTVILCRDTSGFVANRIGCFWMAAAALIARDQGLTVEEADAVHQVFGVPKTGVFGLFDLIGIDLVPQVWASLVHLLPAADRFQRFDIAADSLFRDLVAAGRFGRKSGAGFYRKGPAGMEALDLESGDYRPLRPVAPGDLPGGGRDLGALLADPGRAGSYARRLLAEVIGYAAAQAPAIAADPADVDVALRLGYAWRDGPFALADRWGAGKLAETLAETLAEMGQPLPDLLAQAVERGGFQALGLVPGQRRTSALSVAQLAVADRRIIGNGAATLHDTGDGIGLFAIHTKMNSLHPEVLDLLEQTLPRLGGTLAALVIGNDDPRAFSAGADLRFILSLIDGGERAALESYIDRGQRLFLGLRRAPVPVVAAVHGITLGGGCELALHADAIVAHAETQAGLPEIAVGLIPAWGGCTTVLAGFQARGLAPDEAAQAALRLIFGATRCGSAEEARDRGLFAGDLRLVMHRDSLLAAARARAAALIPGYRPPAELRLDLPAGVDTTTLDLRSDHDRRLAAALAQVLSGPAPRSDAENMAVERAVLFDLIARPETRERMNHMLQTGKPLRN